MSRPEFTVSIVESADGWRVSILEGDRVVSERACRDHLDAQTYASTVRQHLYWLSADTFRAYYRIGTD